MCALWEHNGLLILALDILKNFEANILCPKAKKLCQEVLKS